MATSKGSRRGGQRQGRPAPKGYLRPAQFAAQNHIGINQVYKAAREGRVPHVQFGRTILLPEDALDRMVTGGKSAVEQQLDDDEGQP